MRKLLLLTLSAGATFAQLPQDTLRTQLYAPRTVKQKFLAETPGAVEERRTEHSVQFRKPDGTRVALISQYLHWSDPETGQMRAVEPALWTLDNGWRLEGGPVKARIVRSGTTWTFELYQQRDDKQWKTISFTIPAPSYDQGLSFSFTYQKLTWKLRLTETGFDLTAEVPARQGSQTYSLPLVARLLDLSVDPDTGHLTGNGFALTRAVMVRADRNRTPCSAWRIDGGNVSFTCDDSDFPAEAFPYVIDPSGSFYPTASGDDAWAEAAFYGTYGCPAWPGALAASGYWGGTTTTINQTWSSSAFYIPSCWKYSHQSYVRFDTSSIPSGSTISTASVSVYAAQVQDGNQDFYGGAGCAVQADWYASTNWPLAYNEWSLWGAGNAVAPQDLTGKTPGWYSFTLANLSNIPVGAGAYAGLKWSVPCEPLIQSPGNLYNEFTFYSFDNGPSTKPYLSITYSQPAVQHVITSAPAGRSLTVDGAPCIAPCTFQWTAGTQHTIATTTPQAGGTGTQYLFANWSDGGAISHSITASSSSATYTANFTTQYYLTTAASPPAGGTISPASAWYNSGAVVSVSATTNAGYQFAGFTGDLTGTTTPQNLTMNAPKSVTANFTVLGTVQHVITSSPVGRSLTVDSTPCTAPCTFQWTPGTQHTISTTTPQSGGSGIRYVFASWSDGGARSHSITASSSPATYTAYFTTQYYLTTAASPTAGGTISPASGWRNSGSVVSVSATANAGYQFTGFSGALSGTTTPQNLTMNAPKSVTANFTVSNQPPQAVSVTPSSGSGANQTFALVYSDANGYSDLNAVEALFNTYASQASACDVRYLVGSNALYLRDNAGATWLGPVTLGSADTLHNDQCVIRASTSSASGAGNNLTLNLAVYFKAGFAGGKTIYMYAQDNGGLTSGSYWGAGTWTVPSSVTPASGSLYINLGPLPLNKYEGPNTGDLSISYCTLSTFRDCMQGALANYYNQGMRGVRFQFPLHGAESYAVNPTTGDVDLDWLRRLEKFFFDLRTAGITNIIPSPAVLDDWGFDQYQEVWISDDPCTLNAGDGKTLRFYPHLPFGHEFSGKYKPSGDPIYWPHGTGNNQGYGCAAQNTYNFWGWPKIYDLIDKVLKAAWDQYLTATELDMQNEIFIGASTVTARLIYHHNPTNPALSEPVLDRLRDKMALRMGENYRYRVTFSVGAEYSNTLSSDPSSNCPSVYGDSARLMSLSQFLAAIGGGLIGTVDDSVKVNGLSCGGSTLGMYQLPYPYQTPPSVLDLHEYPGRRPLRDGNGNCAEPCDDVLNYATNNVDVQGQARLDFDALKAMIDAYGPCGYPNCWHGYSPNIYGASVVFGESWWASVRAGSGCAAGPPSAASQMLQGYSSSQLSTRQVIFAPWNTLVHGCFDYPQQVVPPYWP